jgi:hypothetical protein
VKRTWMQSVSCVAGIASPHDAMNIIIALLAGSQQSGFERGEVVTKP